MVKNNDIREMSMRLLSLHLLLRILFSVEKEISMVPWKKIAKVKAILSRNIRKGGTMSTSTVLYLLQLVNVPVVTSTTPKCPFLLLLLIIFSSCTDYNSCFCSHDNQVVVVAVAIVCQMNVCLFAIQCTVDWERESRAVWWARVGDMAEELVCYWRYCSCNQLRLSIGTCHSRTSPSSPVEAHAKPPNSVHQCTDTHRHPNWSCPGGDAYQLKPPSPSAARPFGKQNRKQGHHVHIHLPIASDD